MTSVRRLGRAVGRRASRADRTEAQGAAFPRADESPTELRDGSARASRARGALATSHRVLRAANGHDLTGRAAEAAFFAALALLPAVLTLVAVLHAERPAFGGDAAPRVSADLARLLRVVLTTRGGVAADSADSLLRTPSRGLLGVGTLVAVLVLARGMRSIQRGLAVISAVPARNARREWARAILLAAGVLALGSVLLAAFTLGPLLGHSRQVGGDTADTALHTMWVWARWPVSVLMIFLFATLLLAQERPRRPRRWRASAPGAVLTVLGWSAATGLLPIYVAIAAHVSPTLGSLGGGLIVLVWLYLMTLSLFLGAELNATRLPESATAAPRYNSDL